MRRRLKGVAGTVFITVLVILLFGGQLNTETVFAFEQEPVKAAFEADISNDPSGNEVSVDDIQGNDGGKDTDPTEEKVITGAGDRAAELFLKEEPAGSGDIFDLLDLLEETKEEPETKTATETLPETVTEPAAEAETKTETKTETKKKPRQEPKQKPRQELNQKQKRQMKTPLRAAI